jgi:hypothetical protein
MYHVLPRDASFWDFLFRVDKNLAAQARRQGCSCGGRLHGANYPRKPWGGCTPLPESYRYRLSFCCDRDGCRKRTTPLVRFLGRKVYLAAVVVLVAAMRQGPSPRRVRELTELFGADRRTIASWLYRARREPDDPVGVLRRAVRKDCGKMSLQPALLERLADQYHAYPHWTCQLHYDNLQALVKADAKLGPLRSYSTLRRYMVAQGLLRKPRLKPKQYPGELRPVQRREQREIRSQEAAYVGALWHLDFHHGSLQVVTPRGQWQRPLALGILDDHSRYCPHLQWYLSETTEDLVHGFSQGIQKCGLPRGAMSDNGSATLAEEFTEGLLRLGIVHETTLPYYGPSPLVAWGLPARLLP